MTVFTEAPRQVACTVFLSLIVRCSADFRTSLYCAMMNFLVYIKFVFWFACGVPEKIEVESVLFVSVGSAGGDTRSHPLTKRLMVLQHNIQEYLGIFYL